MARQRAPNSLDELKTKKLWLALLAEFLGVMFLVICACGACIGSSDIVQISLGFAFSIATLVWATAHVSGGHLNPGVTVGFLVARRITLARGLLYVAAQVAGALVGAGVLKASVKDAGNLCTSTSELGAGKVFGIELLITFVLVWTVFATVDGQRTDLSGSGPLAIGLAIGMCHLWAAPLTGAGMNPARVFGPAVVSGTWNDHWAYWIGPLVGGVVAALMYDFLFAVNATPTKFRGYFKIDYNNDNYDRLGEKGTEDETEELHKSGSHPGSAAGAGSKEGSYGATDDHKI